MAGETMLFPFAAMAAGNIFVILLLGVWDSVWKAIAMWKSAKRNHLAWFICIFIFNTIGILPIIYLLIHRRKPKISRKITKKRIIKKTKKARR